MVGEPTFYQEDLEKYISKKKKKIQKSSSYDIENFPELNKYKHFFKVNNNNHGIYIKSISSKINTILVKINIIYHKTIEMRLINL